MPDVCAAIDYLANLDLYKTVKPYWCFLPPREGFDPDKERVDNLEFEARRGITIRDIRGAKDKIKLEKHGFEVLSHATKISEFASVQAVEAYKSETEQLLRETLGAIHVKCYDLRLRKNISFHRTQFDMNDPLHIEGPARGAHNDITISSGPVIINRQLSDDEMKTYIKPGYRFRIVNTWRSLLPVLEDRPLALCDGRSVDPADLVASDRIIPDRIGEVYYLTYNPQHEWYWLSHQTSSEPFAFVMYDTKAGDHSRFCPHVSFINPLALVGAPPRQSVETRSVVITKED